MPALTALPFSTLVFSTRGLSAFIGTTFRATHRLRSIIESRYARDYIPKFQAEFGVAEEEPDGPFQGFIQGYRQGLGHHVATVQHPGTDWRHPEGAPVNVDFNGFPLLNHLLVGQVVAWLEAGSHRVDDIILRLNWWKRGVLLG